jgi:hypothetical protein
VWAALTTAVAATVAACVGVVLTTVLAVFETVFDTLEAVFETALDALEAALFALLQSPAWLTPVAANKTATATINTFLSIYPPFFCFIWRGRRGSITRIPTPL